MVQMSVGNVRVNDDRQVIHQHRNVCGLQIVQSIIRIVQGLIIVASKVLDILAGDTLALHKVGDLVHGGVVHGVQVVQDVQLGGTRHLPQLLQGLGPVPGDADRLAAMGHQAALGREKCSTSVTLVVRLFSMGELVNF